MSVDGAVQKEGVAGGGAVIRDHHGMFRRGACPFFSNTSVPEHTELLACKRGVQLVLELGVEKLCLETDNRGVAIAMQPSDQDRSRFGPLVEETKELLHGVEEPRVIW